MDPTERRRLGRTDIEVTAMGFGCAPLGDLFTVLSDDVAEATLAAAWDAGIRYYDTAPWYGRGGSEHRAGRFLRRQIRDEVRLSTKVGRVFRAPISEAAGARRRAAEGWAGGLEFVHAFAYDAACSEFGVTTRRSSDMASRLSRRTACTSCAGFIRPGRTRSPVD